MHHSHLDTIQERKDKTVQAVHDIEEDSFKKVYENTENSFWILLRREAGHCEHLIIERKLLYIAKIIHQQAP